MQESKNPVKLAAFYNLEAGSYSQNKCSKYLGFQELPT